MVKWEHALKILIVAGMGLAPSLARAANENISGKIATLRFNPSGNVALVVKNSQATKYLWFPGNSTAGRNFLATILSARATGTEDKLFFRYSPNGTGNNSNQSGGCAGFENASATETDPNSGWYCNEVLFIDYVN